VKPGLRETLGFDLVDMRDVATAGVIDNIMRAQIRDAAFILADLTDANPGAYWEAGFAEGLGKPVIYLCESAKFEDARTHFDTKFDGHMEPQFIRSVHERVDLDRAAFAQSVS
jgi:nucleoside 2-deoxyribosyltransferase